MKSILLDVSEDSQKEMPKIDAVISFRKYIAYLKDRISREKSVRKIFLQMVIEKLEENPAFLDNIPIAEIHLYEEQLNLVYGLMIPAVADEKNILWALSTPISPTIFFGTDNFYNLMTEEKTGQIRCDLVKEDSMSMKQKALIVYAIILEKFYNFPATNHTDMLVSLRDNQTGLQKFYKINIDTRFTDVILKGELPDINLDYIRRQFQENADSSELVRLLPLSLFKFEGISVLTLTDVTDDHAVENLKNTILNRNSFGAQAYYQHITDSLKMLVENRDVEFGMMPLLRVNNRLIFNKSTILHSKLINAATASDVAEETYISMAEEYFKSPKVLFMRNITADDEKHEFVKILKNDGVESYALLPVYYDNKIVGVLEVFSSVPNAIDEHSLSKINPALPLIAQIFENNIDEFNANIENVIREKFTSLQPAVQWKFKDVAWHYLRDRNLKPHTAVIESIGFKDVYPLYGAIDIRNSTIERNAALREDLRLQFTVLIDTFCVLKQKLGFGLADEMVFKCKKMLAQITDETRDNDEMKIQEFLESEVHPFLTHFKENRVTKGAAVLALAGSDDTENENEEISEAIDKYFRITNPQTGAAYTNRRALESSMQTINSSVNLYLDLFKTEIQQSYPTYFEKFRTDGIEYDIYIGQSIEPQKTFSNLYLKNIRLWQLTSMAAIARITHSLLPAMEKPLLTTQLIFINSGSIDISFRDDERRFDVEGAYNIRYQVIKKRIDKVHVKGTGERLTQPGKIAMVYFNNKSAEEYVDYIRYLQEQNTLLDDLEYLDLEELQGVNGLKALRIGVNLDSAWK
ncbi:GAF domain-containing protein [Dyadobacter psychrotolerans]|uniref:GAF domain-containing protein n=1 Tax=Dyadobacter psychrotolerans TaxID=2541721 RepID=A0A4R5DV00_9BACT|nr:GAF domain-containing protein [Dyadobacter psychrotolerans]TDE17627.1 GAF domain-containing protein [Dyadobacter psychrotolerans]